MIETLALSLVIDIVIKFWVGVLMILFPFYLARVLIFD